MRRYPQPEPIQSTALLSRFAASEPRQRPTIRLADAYCQRSLSFGPMAVTLWLAIGLIPCAAAEDGAGNANDSALEAIDVSDTPLLSPGAPDTVIVDPGQSISEGVDAANSLAAEPGYSVNDNGPLAGQVQHRGMFGPRMDTRVNGMYINPGGPNWMDPPLHYAPPGLIENLEADRGIAAVSSGAESIGGSANARLKRSEFAPTGERRLGGDVQGDWRSNGSSRSGSGFFEAASDTQRAHAMATASRGGDRDFPDGTIEASQHQRSMVGAGYGVRPVAGHELGFNLRHHETDDTGNPALPLDTRFFDTDIAKADYSGELALGTLTAELSYSDIEHQMDNVTLRRPGPGNPRRVDASSTGLGWSLGLSRSLPLGELSLGLDGHRAEHDMVIRNPRNAAFRVRNFNDVERHRDSLFGEWQGDLTGSLSAELGARVTRVDMAAGQAGTGSKPGAPPVKRLVGDFNSGDRDAEDTQLDWVAKLSYQASDRIAWHLEAGRKTRSPSYIERFAWLPIEATAGLADGNNHIGQVDLDPEVAHEIGAGFDWSTAVSYLRPRVFYRDVDGFITGTPFDDTPGVVDSDVERVSNVNGDPTPLIYSNTGARFYGFDVDFGYQFDQHWRMTGAVSLTRAERTDIDDNIYRVPPAHGHLRLQYERPSWEAFVGTNWAATEERISETNNDASTADPETSGYAVVNAGLGWSPTPATRLRLAVNNVFDRRYEQQLGGFNRVADSDVERGERLPGAGRHAVVRISASF